MEFTRDAMHTQVRSAMLACAAEMVDDGHAQRVERHAAKVGRDPNRKSLVPTLRLAEPEMAKACGSGTGTMIGLARVISAGKR